MNARAEEGAGKSYRKALQCNDLPAALRAVLEPQYQGVARNHGRSKMLRDQARRTS